MSSINTNRGRETIISWRQHFMKRDTIVRVLSALLLLVALLPAVQAAIVVDAGVDRTVTAGEAVSIVATYTDTEASDAENRTATFDWETATESPAVVPDDEFNGTASAEHTYLTAGTYAVTVNVTNDITQTEGSDVVNVTVVPQAADVKIVPKTLNAKSNGVLTVFVSLARWLGFADEGDEGAVPLDYASFGLANATPERVHFTMKDGGTLMLKFKRQDLDLNAGDESLTVTGNLTTGAGAISVAGSDAVSVINPGNGKKVGKDNGKAVAKGKAGEESDEEISPPDDDA
jgi:hypothetical protein